MVLNSIPRITTLFGRLLFPGVGRRTAVVNSNLLFGAFKMGEAPGPVQSAIAVKLRQELKPEHMDIINESYMHNVPKGAESHFKVVVISDQFEGKPAIQRHRMVHSVLHEELETGAIHALSVVARTPSQWAQSTAVESSPKCMGGSNR